MGRALGLLLAGCLLAPGPWQQEITGQPGRHHGLGALDQESKGLGASPGLSGLPGPDVSMRVI